MPSWLVRLLQLESLATDGMFNVLFDFVLSARRNYSVNVPSVKAFYLRAGAVSHMALVISSK